MSYANGQIPLSELVPLSVKSPTLGIQYAVLRVAAAYERLNAKFKARFGKDLVPTEGYRNLAREKLLHAAYVRYLNGGPWAPLAAIEGTSIHGFGEAIDFGSGVATYGTAEKAWLNEHGPEEGFFPTGDKFSPREAWHFDDLNTVPADTGIPTQIMIRKKHEMKFGIIKGDGDATVYCVRLADGAMRPLTPAEYAAFLSAGYELQPVAQASITELKAKSPAYFAAGTVVPAITA